MKTTTLAEHVREHVTFTRESYESREWMNVRSALARLVQNCDELTTKNVRHALDCLHLEHELSPSYRRSCWTRWRRFFRRAVEHELASVELLVHVQAWRPRFSRPRSPDESLTPPRREPPLTFVRVRDAF